MMLVEADAVEAEPVDLFPGRQMLGVGAHRDIRFEMLLRQWIGQPVCRAQMVQLLAVSMEIEDENLHARILQDRGLLPTHHCQNTGTPAYRRECLFVETVLRASGQMN